MFKDKIQFKNVNKKVCYFIINFKVTSQYLLKMLNVLKQ